MAIGNCYVLHAQWFYLCVIGNRLNSLPYQNYSRRKPVEIDNKKDPQGFFLIHLENGIDPFTIF